jgi:hypothetical protein
MATMNKPASDSTNWYSSVDANWTSIENNLIDKNLLLAKGDLLVALASASLSRLPVALDGQVLAANSGALTGLAWTELNAGATIFTRTAKATTAVSTNSSTMSDLDSMNLTINVAASRKVLVIFNATLRGSNYSPSVRLLRNGLEIRSMNPRSNDATWSAHTTLVTLDQPGAGTHTYKIQWRTDNGNTLNNDLQPYSSNGDRELILIGLPG